ncbi:MAG TPA: anion transporter [Chitinophagaceae bacterium]|nr:anion transporter [Chitinophagaceae bacterium]HAN40033.1 anion transporter [Chitinophagaceae bacterium]
MQYITASKLIFMPLIQRNVLLILVGVLIAISLYAANIFHLPQGANKVAAVAVLMIFLWISEALPLPAVALFPLVLFPLLGIAKLDVTAAPYANSIIFLFMGGFMIGLAIEKWQLHRRIALRIVKITGTSGNKIVLGFILATGLLSMWLSNTATTMMMYPIAMSVVHVLEQTHGANKSVKHIGICLLLSIAYASNYGGIATLIGTPPNVAYAAFVEKHYAGYAMSFFEWMAICTPLALLLLLALYWVLTRWLYKNDIQQSADTAAIINNELKALGPVTIPEKRVLIIFITTALLWVFKDVINTYQTQLKFDDTIIAMMGALTLFMVPSGSYNGSKMLMEWSDTSKMAWGILLLFGGGLTLATQLEATGIVGAVGKWLASLSGTGGLGLVLAVTVLSILISEVTSNIAQVIVFAPVMSSIADNLHINPLLLGIPMTLAASCAAMLPMGTPPNAIVFASGRLQLKDMLLTGFIMNVVSIMLITLFSWYLIPLIMHAIGT